MNVNLISFGYRSGVPNEADIVFDAREITNPQDTKSLRHLRGTDVAVQKRVLNHPVAHRILADANAEVMAKQQSGEQEVFLGIGCWMGRHRSVALVEILAEQMVAAGHDVRVEHRDKDKSFERRRGDRGK